MTKESTDKPVPSFFCPIIMVEAQIGTLYS